MPRYKLTIEYDGAPFVGWQAQENGLSVQAVLAAAITAFCGAVAVLSAEVAAGDFDARFSATRRHYRYRIVNRRADLALDRRHAWRIGRPLDAGAMRAAAQRLVGKHDFTTFRAAECQAKSPVKTLDRLDVDRDGEEIFIHASARSFLHTQVRSMVGSLALVGEGRWSGDDLARALNAKDRTACGPVAPPDGLYLVRVDY
jgi:tRNA pseudouridine38-40 synthase